MTNSKKKLFRGELYFNHNLASYTTWRVGGDAKEFFRPADVKDLSKYLQQLSQDIDLLWLGLGSNLLIRDSGFNGAVIYLQGRINDMSISKEGIFNVGAGATCSQVARFAARKGFVGSAFLAGIPGTMGGALAMNAGAFGGETWAQINSVKTINRDGLVKERTTSDYKIDYRHVDGPEKEWFVGCSMTLVKGDVKEEQTHIRQLLDKRNGSQPIGKPSAGSTFKNPENDFAARLIEESDLKGYEIGGAQVSEKHANFIINTGDATAKDIEALIDYVALTVNEKHQIELVKEVHIAGEKT